jgi:hypothetical protein
VAVALDIEAHADDAVGAGGAGLAHEAMDGGVPGTEHQRGDGFELGVRRPRRGLPPDVEVARRQHELDGLDARRERKASTLVRSRAIPAAI